MRTRSSCTTAVTLALLAMLGTARASAAQSGWQPAAGRVQLPLWPAEAPDASPAPGPEAVHHATDPDTKRKRLVGGAPYVYVENVTRPTMTLYRPTGRNTGAAVMVYPGGGFNVLAMDIEGTEACDWLTARGITCVLLKYRVPCRHEGDYRDCPPAHQDAERALRLVRSRAAEWRIDPRRIGVLGFSAGAHMAIVRSTRVERTYAPVDAADSASARPDFALVLYPGRVTNRRVDWAVNPAIRVTDRTPPTFLVHAADDDLNPVENSLFHATALRRAGVPVELHVFAEGGHAFGLRRTARPVTRWTALAEAWLEAMGVMRR